MTLCERCGFRLDGPLHAEATSCREPAATLPDGTRLFAGSAAPFAPERWLVFGRKDTPGEGTRLTTYGFNAEGTALTTFATRADAEAVARAIAAEAVAA